MVLREFLIIGVVLACAFSFVQCSSDDNGESRVKVISIANMTDFLKKNPELKVHPLVSKIAATTPVAKRQYSYGVRLSGKTQNNLNDSPMKILLITHFYFHISVY